MTKSLHITDHGATMRIDAYLASILPDYSRTTIMRALKDARILCNDKKVKPQYKLRVGDVITYDDLPVTCDTLQAQSDLALDIVDATDDFLIINKRRGIQVHPSSTQKHHTLVNAIIARYPEIRTVGDDDQRPGIVHRLDKYTSGLMIVARNQKAFCALKALFASRAVHKTYHTLVWGVPSPPEGLIDAPIARAMSYTKQKVVLHHTGRFRGDAKEAQTHYAVLRTFDAPFTRQETHDKSLINPTTGRPQISHVRVQPKTGRMHQIRVHMRHINHPIVGDVKYETKGFHLLNEAFFATLDQKVLHTFYLHAHDLAFTLNGTDYAYSAPLPTYFRDVLPPAEHISPACHTG